MNGKKSVAVMVLSIFVFTIVGWGFGEILKRQTVGTVGGHLKVLVEKGGGLTDVNVGSIAESIPKAIWFELNYLGSISVAGILWFNTDASDKWLRKAVEWDRGTINAPYAGEDILNNSYEYKGNIISGRKAVAIGGAMKIVPILLTIIIGIIAGRFFTIKMSSKK